MNRVFGVDNKIRSPQQFRCDTTDKRSSPEVKPPAPNSIADRNSAKLLQGFVQMLMSRLI